MNLVQSSGTRWRLANVIGDVFLRSAGIEIVSLAVRLQEWLSVRKRARDLVTLRSLLNPSPELRLLDVGGGAGAATERFASGCGEIVVVEPDPRKIALGRKLRPKLRFVEGHAEALPFPDASFDRVVSVVAFHHMKDQEQALTEMRRVLRPSGLLVVVEMDKARGPGCIGHWLARLRHAERLHFLDPTELAAKMTAQGFRSVTAQKGALCYFVLASK
jgi:SAM-dependent methyltransferase